MEALGRRSDHYGALVIEGDDGDRIPVSGVARPSARASARASARGSCRDMLVERIASLQDGTDLAGSAIGAEHPRHTAARLVIDPAHYDGSGTKRVHRPTPLGRLGVRLQKIAEMPVERRPLDLYAALAEVAR